MYFFFGLPLSGEHSAEDAVQFCRRLRTLDAAVSAKLEAIQTAAERQQRHGHNMATYQVGDRVWVVRPDMRDKLGSRWTGPHVVVDRCGENTYEFDVGNKVRRCHVAQMKKMGTCLSRPKHGASSLH